jgi:2-polyprenyl-3-methyl-5-hydroxy-6-metoxy-1,4-benzoquinol methylase
MDHHYRLKHDPHSSHQQIAKMVRELNRGPILDVGAAQGMLGQLLHGSGLEIDAVEPNPQWADAARAFYRNVHAGTIETCPQPPHKYQLIICGDVLEHVVDPVTVLKQLQQCATPDATFIISVPNVAHIAVRMLLLFGFFPQMARGILDRTHLHFYTRDTAQQMLADAGLQIEHISCTPVPTNEMGTMMRAAAPLQRIALKIFPRLFAMQWIFLARAGATR